MKHEMMLIKKFGWFYGPRILKTGNVPEVCAAYFHTKLDVPKHIEEIYIVFYKEKPARSSAYTYQIKEPYCPVAYRPAYRVATITSLYGASLMTNVKIKLSEMYDKGYRYIQVEWEE